MPLLEAVPERFRGAVGSAPGEQLLGSWHGVRIQPDAKGRVNTGGDLSPLDTSWGLLVLSNYSLRHYLDHGRGDFFVTAARPGLEETIPLGSLLRVDLLRHHALAFEPVLFLRAERSVLFSGRKGPSRSPLAWLDLYFVIDPREDPGALFRRTVAAAQVAAAQLQSYRGEEGSSPLSDDNPKDALPEAGPIHFHAEAERED